MKNIVIIGASSAIAQETAKIFAERKARLFLVARNAEKLNALAKDLKVRGAESVESATFEASDYNQHETLSANIQQKMGSVDFVLLAQGDLPDQIQGQKDFSVVSNSTAVNFLSLCSFLTFFANFMEKQGHGTLAAISSVAGDRGRKSNYIYASAKAGLDAFLSGLRARLLKSGVRVLNIKPGFVDTPMTAHIQPKGALWATPEVIARGIVRAAEKNKSTVYLPFFWRYIMAIIKSLPSFIFNRMNF